MADPKSQQLYLVNSTPGVFYTDDIQSNPHPERLRGYDPTTLKGNISQSTGQTIKETNAPFMLGTWNSRNSDLDKHDTVWHMYNGNREGVDLNAPKKKWDHWYGWGNLFSSVQHSVSRPSGDNIANTPNLHLYTNHQMREECAILIGSKSIEEAYKCTARWMSPIGIQFKWHNWFTKGNATGMKIQSLFLMYTDNWAPGKLLYAPIIKGGMAQHGNTRTYGASILSDDAKLNGGYEGGRSGGEFVGFVDPNSMDVIQDRFTISACVGLWIGMQITDYDGASYDKCFDFWDMKLLFDDTENDSRIVYPAPHNLQERMENESVKLL